MSPKVFEILFNIFSTEVTNTNGYTPKTNIGSSNKAQMKPSALIFLNIFTMYIIYQTNRKAMY